MVAHPKPKEVYISIVFIYRKKSLRTINQGLVGKE
jgi:hypothetical protein